MSSYKKFAKNTFWFALGNFGSKTISFLMIPLYTSVLTTEFYGKMDLLTITITLLVPLLTLQIADASLRFGLGEGKDKERVFTNSLVVVVGGVLISLLLYPLFSFNPIFKDYLLYFYVILWMSMISSLFKFFLRTIDKIQVAAVGDILYTLIFVCLNIYLLVNLRMGIEGYFISMAIGFLIMNGYMIIRGGLHKYVNLKKIDKNKIKNMVAYSAPLVPNTLNWWIMNVSDRYIVTYFLGLSATGLYAVAYKLPSIITILNSIFYSSWQVSAIEEFDSEDRDKFYSSIFKLNFTLVVIMVSGLLLMLKPIFSVWVAPNYYIAWKYSPFLILGVGISAFSSFYGVGYLATKNTIGAFYTSVAGAVINIVVNIALVPLIGLQAASLSTLLSYVVMWIIRIYQTKSYFKVTLNVKVVLISLILLIAQIGLLLAVDKLWFLHQLLILILLILINKESIKGLMNVIIKKIKKR